MDDCVTHVWCRHNKEDARHTDLQVNPPTVFIQSWWWSHGCFSPSPAHSFTSETEEAPVLLISPYKITNYYLPLRLISYILQCASNFVFIWLFSLHSHV